MFEIAKIAPDTWLLGGCDDCFNIKNFLAIKVEHYLADRVKPPPPDAT